MGYTCCVDKCKTGYCTNPKKKNLNYQSPCLDCVQTKFHVKNGFKLFHKKNLKISDSCRICVQHFVVIYSNYPYQISKNKKSGNKRVELKTV